ncbi:MAG: hypothetical protein K8T90_02285 [Planctomycetes bacterium]|nr:hypothetical protein [Planctomycetota bacterium]
MCGRILLWAILMGFAGGWGGVLLATTLWPDDFQAPAIGLTAGATLGAAVGTGGVLLVSKRQPGD